MTTEITLFHLSAGARVHVRAANLRENDAGQHGVPETEGKRAARFEMPRIDARNISTFENGIDESSIEFEILDRLMDVIND